MLGALCAFAVKPARGFTPGLLADGLREEGLGFGDETVRVFGEGLAVGLNCHDAVPAGPLDLGEQGGVVRLALADLGVDGVFFPSALTSMTLSLRCMSNTRSP